MTSLIGAMLITCACGACGFLYADSRKRELAATEGMCQLFEYLLLRLPSLAIMEDILAEFDNDELERMGFLTVLGDKSKGATCNKRFCAAIELFSKDSGLYPILLQAGQGLGGTEYCIQESSLKSAHDRLQLLHKKRSTEFAAGEKCYRWLGVLVGAAVSILMI